MQAVTQPWVALPCVLVCLKTGVLRLYATVPLDAWGGNVASAWYCAMSGSWP